MKSTIDDTIIDDEAFELNYSSVLDESFIKISKKQAIKLALKLFNGSLGRIELEEGVDHQFFWNIRMLDRNGVGVDIVVDANTGDLMRTNVWSNEDNEIYNSYNNYEGWDLNYDKIPPEIFFIMEKL